MIAAGVIVAYLLGSIPTAVWYGKIFHGVDIRQHGSGNAGATNSLRTFGKKAGIIVLLIDFLKGFLAVYSSRLFSDDTFAYLPLLMGVAVIIGHIFPVFAQFRGGKGVATAMGVVVGVLPPAALGCLVAFLIIVFLTKYVSLAAMVGALAFPVQVTFNVWNSLSDKYYIAFSWLLFFILVFTHRQNIKRLLSGNENKIGAKK